MCYSESIAKSVAYARLFSLKFLKYLLCQINTNSFNIHLGLLLCGLTCLPTPQSGISDAVGGGVHFIALLIATYGLTNCDLLLF